MASTWTECVALVVRDSTLVCEGAFPSLSTMVCPCADEMTLDMNQVGAVVALPLDVGYRPAARDDAVPAAQLR